LLKNQKITNYIRYVFVLTFQSYGNHFKLRQMTNMNIDEFKLNIHFI